MNAMMKLGSLFDGIGGFPIAAIRHGITPVWASEIEPAAVSISRRHFPDMVHLGDITKINGAEIEPVDIITFGSPCQDLSIAGKRAGLAGERSGLFGEAIRIIEEMRKATHGKSPTWIIWENVTGALSSNDGLDFRAVLRAISNSDIPIPPYRRWAGAGMVRGGRCDIGWRVLDAQFWGVPQRRRRIFLVADFGGERAAEILFKPESLRRDFKAGGAQGQEAAGYVGDSAETAVYENHGQDSRITGPLSISPTVSQKWGTGGNNTPLVLNDQGGSVMDVSEGVVGTLRSETHGNVPCIVAAYSFDSLSSNSMKSANPESGCREVGIAKTLDTSCPDPSKNQGGIAIVYACRTDQTGSNGLGVSEDISYTLDGATGQAVVELSRKTIVRRLTPTECERLQGFPDDWTAHGHDGKAISDSARYRALGNSVAIPCVEYIMAGMAEAAS